MMIDIHPARLQFGKGEHLKLKGACSTRLTTVSGVAWITIERDASDTLLAAGQSFVVPSDRTVVVGPLDSSLTLDVQGARHGMRLTERPNTTTGKRLRALRASLLERLPWRTGVSLPCGSEK